MDEYAASLGGVLLGKGVALNAGPFGPGRYAASQPATRVEVTALDDLGFAPWLTVCVDLNNNNLCSANDGDYSASAPGKVAVEVDPAMAFRQVQVYAYAVGVDADGLRVASTGLLIVTFSA